MKKVLLINESMNFGGVARACMNFIKNMKEEYSIDVLLLNKEGEVLEELDNLNVEVLEANSRYKNLTTPWFKAKAIGGKTKFCKLFTYGLEKLSLHKLVLNWASKKEKEYNYDVCISFTQSIYSMDLALKKVNANKKIVFVHGELNLLDKSKAFIKLIKKFDKIVCVSKSCRDQLREYLNEQERVEFLYNFQDTESIIKLAGNGYEYNNNKFNIVTVGRCCKEKGIDRLPEILSKLNKDVNVCWHIVGDGPLKQEVYNELKNLNLLHKVNFIGFQSNPYYYIKNASLLAIISYSEAAPMVIGESFSLGVPVLTTSTTSAEELIKNHGYICENTTPAIIDAVNNILTNKNEYKTIQASLKDYEYNNASIKEQAIKIIEE